MHAFKCPDCGFMEQIEEVVTEATIIYEVHFDDEGIMHRDIGVKNCGTTSYFQCIECGFIPLNPDESPCSNAEQLKTWIQSYR